MSDELDRLGIEIADLEGKLQGIRTNEANLREATDAAQGALTGALRRYASDPSDAMQELVAEAETRLSECRKRQFTSGSAGKVIATDLAALRSQHKALAAAQERRNELAALGDLREELAGVTEQLQDLLVRWGALKSICDGHPTGLCNPNTLIDHDMRKAMDVERQNIKGAWRHGN